MKKGAVIYLPKSRKTDKDSTEYTAQSLSICCSSAWWAATLSSQATAGEG